MYDPRIPMRVALAIAALLVAGAASRVAQAQDEVIDDPLLQGSATRPPTPPTPPPPPRKLWSAVVVSRAAMQTSWDDLPGGPKDVLESRTRAVLSASDKPSDHLKWEIGVRFDAIAASSRAVGGEGLAEPAWRFEARPWEAYLDVGLGDRVRLKVGNQIVAWGRLDLGSAADVLSTYDLRQGPVVDPDELRVPTPTVSLAWFPSARLQLDVGYTPFFTPHRFDVVGTNYAFVGPNAPAAVAGTFRRLRQQVDATTYLTLTNDLAKINAPTARPDNGELAARGTWRLGVMDVAVTYGFVRSKVPALSVHPALTRLLTPGADLSAGLEAAQAAQRGDELVGVRYDRYHQLALDLEAPAGPITMAAEIGFSPERTLFTRDPASGLPKAVTTPVAQTGVRATWVHGDNLVVNAEASLFVVPARQAAPYLVFGSERRLATGMLVVHDELGRHVLEAAALGTSSGPSLSLVPRYGFRFSDAVLAGVGGAFFFGSRTDEASLGAIQKGLDQVLAYVDVRL